LVEVRTLKPTVETLVSLWDHRRREGTPASAEELCRDCPELLADLRRRLAGLQAMEQFLQPATTDPDIADPGAGLHAITPPLPHPQSGPARLPQVHGYEVLGELGKGGMGVVYQARHCKLGRLVALKMIKAGANAEAEDLQRFRGEAEAVARLQHRHIVQVFEVGEHQGTPYCALEFCGGGSLEKKLAGTPLPPFDAARLVQQLAEGVAAAHAKEIIHRDLKPANVLLAEDGTPKVTDFGLAKRLDTDVRLTQSGAVMGSPPYMPPEQARGGRTGPLADVYALGATLYELLTGRPPFKAATVMDTLLQVINEEPVPPARLNPRVPRDLETICLKCLHKDPLRRYGSASALAEDLGQFLAGLPINGRPVGRVERTWKWMRRHPAAAALIAALVLLVTGSSAVAVWYTNDQADRAIQETLRVAEEKQKEQLRLAEKKQEVLQKELVVQGGLKQAAELKTKALWRQAEKTLKQQLDLLGPAGDAQLRKQVETALVHLAVVEHLDRIRSERIMPVEGNLNYAAAAPRYAAAFVEQRLDITGGEETTLVQGLQRSPLRDYLLAALDDWLVIERDPALRSRLCQLTAKITGHAWREELRALWDDADGLVELLDRVPPQQMTVALLIGLCNRIERLGGDGVVLLERARLRHPADFWVWFELGVAYSHRGGEYASQADGALIGALAIRQDSAVVWTSLGHIIHVSKDLAGAIAAYKEAIRLDPNLAQPHFNLGNALQDSQDLAGAIAAYKQAIDLDPNFPLAHFNLGDALHARKDLASAIAAFKEGLRLDPKDAKAHNNLGIALHDSKDLAGAIAAYKKAIDLDPKYAKARNNLGLALRGSQDLAGAIAAHKKAIELDPKDAKAHTNLGVALYDSKDLPGAIAAYQEAIHLDPKIPDAHFNLGVALNAGKDLAGAIAAFKEGLRLDPKDAKAHAALGIILRLHGSLQESVKALTEAGRLLPNDGGIQAQLQISTRWLQLNQRLPDILVGKDNLANAAEAVEFAYFCKQPFQKQYVLALKLYKEVFVAYPKLEAALRYNAACAAVLLAAGQDVAVVPLEKWAAQLRTEARQWLLADLAILRKFAQSDLPAQRNQALDRLAQWKGDPDLASVRDDKELAQLPAAERHAWQQFWADVEQLLTRPVSPRGSNSSN
jgi:serine/threonine-protein kinase